MRILRPVTYAVTSTGNLAALHISLSSILMGTELPSEILLRMEGVLPSTSDFYLEQLSEVARLLGVEFTISVKPAQGIRNARDWLVDRAQFDDIFMGDDDVLFEPNALKALFATRSELLTEPWAWICGAKPDVNNRRGYADFSTKFNSPSQVVANGFSNLLFDTSLAGADRCFVQATYLDTGFVMLDRTAMQAAGVRFHEEGAIHYNSGGEDTLLGLKLLAKGYTGYFCPSAMSYHLEKPKVNFGELPARAEAIHLAVDKLGIPSSLLEGFMPGIPKFKAQMLPVTS